jgi:hypothetical protein
MTERRSMFSVPVRAENREGPAAAVIGATRSVTGTRKRWTSLLQPCLVLGDIPFGSGFCDRSVCAIQGSTCATLERLAEAAEHVRHAQPAAFVGICDERLRDRKHRQNLIDLVAARGGKAIGVGCEGNLELSQGFHAVLRDNPR